ncbi:MAG: FHA domain-containing protein [Gammaproteobacteria bacterium]|nr:FHA domain-containing protein [Gammaproteobacteria bacterium]
MAYLTQFSSSVPVIKFHIDQSVMTIGQDFDMDICVPEDGIADNHATIEVVKQAVDYRFIIKSNEDEALLELNGESVAHANLKDGDWLIIGGVEFQFTDDGINEFKDNIVPISMGTQNSVTPIKEREDLKPMSTKEYIEESRFSRRLNRF